MPTVAKIVWPQMKMKYGWCLKISSVDELQDYWLEARGLKIREGFANYLNSAEFEQATGKGRRTHHVNHDESYLVAMSCHVEGYRENPRSAVEVFVDVYDEVYKGMAKTIEQFGPIYINERGGYFWLGKDMVETDLKNVDQFVIPGEKITVRRWPNGIHFYSYVGGVSVDYRGRNKWDTEKEAVIAAQEWAKENNLKVEKYTR